MVDNCKIRIKSPEHCAKVLKEAFKSGFSWTNSNGNQELKFTENTHSLYIQSGKISRYGIYKDPYNSSADKYFKERTDLVEVNLSEIIEIW